MRRDAASVYLLTEGVFGFAHLLMGTMFSVYLIVEAGFDPFQLVIMGTVLELTALVFEVPTGVLADAVSRRLSVIVGFVLTGLGFGLTGLVESFWLVAAAQVLWGIGYTFISGAHVAWITDEVGEEAASKLYVRGAQRAQIGCVLGIAASAGLATISLGLPLVLSGVVLVALALYLVGMMPEDHFPGRGTERIEFLSTFRGGVKLVRGKPVLMLIMVICFFQGMSTEGFDRLAHLHLIEDVGIPALGSFDRVLWFGILDGGGFLLALAGAEYIKRKVDVTSHRGAARALALIDVFLIALVGLFAFAVNFYAALLLFWLVALFREINEPILLAWVNQGLEPRSRATINSMAEQSWAFGEASGGLGLGLTARATVPGAIAISGFLRAPALLLFWRALRYGSVGDLPPGEMEPVSPEPPPPSDTVVVNAPNREV